MGFYAHSQVFCIRHTRQASRDYSPKVINLWLPSTLKLPCSRVSYKAGVLGARLGSEGDRAVLAEREVNLNDLFILGS